MVVKSLHSLALKGRIKMINHHLQSGLGTHTLCVQPKILIGWSGPSEIRPEGGDQASDSGGRRRKLLSKEASIRCRGLESMEEEDNEPR
jgi:hypothetical protein